MQNGIALRCEKEWRVTSCEKDNLENMMLKERSHSEITYHVTAFIENRQNRQLHRESVLVVARAWKEENG